MALIISETAKVEAGTDFYIDVNSITDRDDTALDLEATPFYFEFFGATEYAKVAACKELADSEKYIVSFEGTERVNNIYADGVLKFKFENYPICSSKLYYRQIENYTNSDFEDGTETIYTTPTKALSITISPTGGNSMTSDSSISATVTLGALKGEKGDTPYIGDNGNWWIGNIDTGVIAGDTNLSDYPTKAELEKYFETESIKVLDRINIGAATIYKTTKTDDDGNEVEAGYIYTERGNIYTIKGNIYTSNGDIYTSKGDIYTVDGDFTAREGSYYKGSGNYKIEVAYKDELPTKTSNLTNDSGFVDNTTENLDNYYLKTETFSRVEAFELLSDIDPSTLPYATYDGTTDMQSGVSYVYEADATEVVFSLASVSDGRVGIYSLTIAVGDDVPTFSYPSDLIWASDELSLEANTTHELNILNGVVTYISYSNE